MQNDPNETARPATAIDLASAVEAIQARVDRLGFRDYVAIVADVLVVVLALAAISVGYVTHVRCVDNGPADYTDAPAATTAADPQALATTGATAPLAAEAGAGTDHAAAAVQGTTAG